jgi:putative radical SAM enzyme (TIGR03279 family)
MKIVSVDPASPLYGYIRPGYEIVAVNGSRVLDSIDFRFKTADERLRLTFADPKGKKLQFDFDEYQPADLGLTLDDSHVQVCNNKCIFCFVHQQPKGMRRVLYVKDEDYRLSFTHGNFVTLSNITESDMRRIIRQRLSPLYVSVHATDNKLRRCMLGNEKLAPIMPRLKRLTENGISIHAQVVLCPGVNDGGQLEKTIDDLASLAPGVESLAVVPVGLTRYRQRLPELRTYTSDEAGEIIDYIEKRQKEFAKRLGTRFVWPADEFYVAADRPFPSHSSYEEMTQFENGIGMAREFITVFNRRRRQLKSIKSDRRVLMLTGHSAFPFLSTEIIPYLTGTLRLPVELQVVDNVFWGESVTVSGLLTGKNLLGHARKNLERFDTVVLPPNCLNDDDLFLDDLSLEQFQKRLGRRVLVGRYNLADTITEVFQ